METLKEPRKGDVFYTQFNKRYYFMQIIHITKDLPPPYDVDYKYGYFIIMFQKAYKKLPKSIDELDLINIYKIKYKPKNTILFISHWAELPEIKMDTETENYKKHSKYEIKYFGNTAVSKEFNPKIYEEYILPAHTTKNNEDILISHKPVDISWLFYILEQDNEYKNKKIEKVNSKYFKGWLETIESEILIKMETIIKKYENANENIPKELKKCINAINKLDERYHFIMTMEAEDIYNVLIKISKKHKFNDFEKIMEENREW
jgi:hypothetical protein